MVHFGVYFDTILPSENYRNIHLLHKNNDIAAARLMGVAMVNFDRCKF